MAPEAGGRESAALARQSLRTEVSRRFRDSSDLVECGLLNPGQWF